MKLDNDDINALFATVLIHFVAFLLLYFCVITTSVNLEDGGIPVTFGDLYAMTGSSQPAPAANIPSQRETTPTPATPQRTTQTTPQRTTQTTPQRTTQQTTPQRTTQTTNQRSTPTTKPEVNQPVTQDKTKTVTVPETTKKTETTKTETAAVNNTAQREREEAERKKEEAAKAEAAKAEAAQRHREEAERKQQEAINSQISNAFGPGGGQGNSQGGGQGNSQGAGQGESTSGATNQGSPFGNSDSGAKQGTGGFGSFNLNGRSLGSGGLPRPAYNERVEGRIVINITVDPNGNVIMADVALRGTNIDNASMRKSALDAAKRAKFNKITGANNQTGTITYNYKLN